MDTHAPVTNPTAPNRGHEVWVTSVVTVIIAGISVIVRLVARYRWSSIRLDDWMVLVALLFSILFSITINIAVMNGYGMHEWDLSNAEAIEAHKWYYVATIVYKVAIGCAKISILEFYLRIFYVRSYFRWACYTLIAVTASSIIAFTLVTIWQCRPISNFWDRTLPNGDCINIFAFWMAYSLVNVVTDFSVLILPVQQVLRLKLSGRDKVALVLVFSLGILVCIASVFRTTTLRDSSDYEDPTWHSALSMIWALVETNVAIICSCLSIFRQPVSRFVRRVASHPESAGDDDERHLRASSHSSPRYRPQPCSFGRPSLIPSEDGSAPWNMNWYGGDGDLYMTSISAGCGGSTRRSDSLAESMNNSMLGQNGILKQTEVHISNSTAGTGHRAP